MIKIDEFKPLSRTDITRLSEANAISEAVFVAGDFNDSKGMILVVSYGTVEPKKGILFKQDNKPRVFTTPEAIMNNAQKLGIDLYQIDATDWEANYYRVYKVQAKRNKERRQQGDDQ